MTEGRSDGAHPSFVHIIQQLTPDEARILTYIKGKGEDFQLDETDAFHDRRPPIHVLFKQFCKDAEVVLVEHSDAYLDNLLRLRILCELIDANSEFRPEGHSDHGWYQAEVSTENRRTIVLTDFGKNFLGACT